MLGTRFDQELIGELDRHTRAALVRTLTTICGVPLEGVHAVDVFTDDRKPDEYTVEVHIFNAKTSAQVQNLVIDVHTFPGVRLPGAMIQYVRNFGEPVTSISAFGPAVKPLG